MQSPPSNGTEVIDIPIGSPTDKGIRIAVGFGSGAHMDEIPGYFIPKFFEVSLTKNPKPGKIGEEVVAAKHCRCGLG